jgi:hypothetical protein
MLKKVSAQDASSLLKTAGATIRALAERNRELENENAAFRKEARAEEIARQMEEKGLNGDLSFSEKVASLKKRDDLEVVEEAVKLASKQNVGLVSIAADGEGPGSGGLHPFETFIATGEVPE